MMNVHESDANEDAFSVMQNLFPENSSSWKIGTHRHFVTSQKEAGSGLDFGICKYGVGL